MERMKLTHPYQLRRFFRPTHFIIMIRSKTLFYLTIGLFITFAIFLHSGRTMIIITIAVDNSCHCCRHWNLFPSPRILKVNPTRNYAISYFPYYSSPHSEKERFSPQKLCGFHMVCIWLPNLCYLEHYY